MASYDEIVARVSAIRANRRPYEEREAGRLREARTSAIATGRLAGRYARRAELTDPSLAEQFLETRDEAARLSSSLGGPTFGVEISETPVVGGAEGFLGKLGNVLGAPVRGVSSTVYEGLFDADPEKSALGAGLEGFLYPSKAKRFGEVYEGLGVPRQAAGALGFATSAIADPLWLVPGGAIAKGLGAGTKAGLGALGKIPVAGRTLADLARPIGRKAGEMFQPFYRTKHGPYDAATKEEIIGGLRSTRSRIQRESEELHADLPAFAKAKGAGIKLEDFGELEASLEKRIQDLYNKQASGDFGLPTRVALEAVGASVSPAALRISRNNRIIKLTNELLGLRALPKVTDPALREGTEFLKKYGTKMSSPKAIREFRELSIAVARTNSLDAKKKLASLIETEIQEVAKRDLVDGLRKLKLEDGTSVVGFADEVGGKGKYVTAPKQLRKWFKGERIYKELANEIRDQPFIGDIRGAARYFRSNAILKAWDNLTARWKEIATGLNLGFHFRNHASNQWLVFQGEGLAGVKLHNLGARITVGANGVYKYKGKEIAFEEIRRILRESGVHRSGFVMEGVESTIKAAFKKQGVYDTVAAKARVFGNTIEDSAKTQIFLANLSRTGDIKKALDQARKFLFDYSDLTYFERQYLRRLFPFYAWMRKNAPLQVEMLFKQPRKTALPFHLQEEGAISMLDPQERKREKGLPRGEYLEELMGIPRAKAPGGGYTYMTQSYLPFAELGDIGSPIGSLASRLHPMLGTGLDLIRGKESFRNLPYEDLSGVPTETRAGGIASAVAKITEAAGVGGLAAATLGTRILPGRGSAAGSDEVRQQLLYQTLGNVLPLVMGGLPGGRIPAALIGTQYLRHGAKAVAPQGPASGVESLAKATGVIYPVTSEPSAVAQSRSYRIALKARQLASRQRAAEGR